jgi:lipid-binding SYLF domain-containing protein
MLVERKSGKKTYMEMAQVNVGLGYGIQNSRIIFVFQTREAMEQFRTQGWDFSGQGGVSAAQSGQGANEAGAISFMPGVMVYQFTKDGLAASITLQGTKFWPDKKLNE